jgi:hypothetical protein
MIDRHYGHLARDGCEHAIRLLDELSAGQWPRWTLRGPSNPRGACTGSTSCVVGLHLLCAILRIPSMAYVRF